jgi:hypothetical protein
MASAAAQHGRRNEPRLFQGPVTFRRTRKAVTELVGYVWLAVQIAQLVRRRVARDRVPAET